ncbi:MAG: carbohydrate ABC transporter permease [Lachnospiraceae bacterium]|nr:carbohydrate ABC transporter permease [Lachnospiraceae bacterium]
MAENYDLDVVANVKPHRRKVGWDTISLKILAYVFIGLFAIICVLPFYLIIIASFTKESQLIRTGYPMLLTEPTVEAYKLVIKNPQQILQAYGVTIFVTVVGTFLSLFMATMTGYVLSRKDFPWRNKFAFFFFFTTLFSGGLVPSFMICTRYLGFKNNILALILPMMFSVWNMIISKTFISNIPSAITESAKIDGANDFLIYFKLILPLSKPLLATLGLFSALAYWNEWYNCMLYIDKDRLYMLQYYLQRILSSADAMKKAAEKSGLPITSVPLESMKMAMTVIATGPIILLYPAVQRYFVKGLTIGAVKG